MKSNGGEQGAECWEARRDSLRVLEGPGDGYGEGRQEEGGAEEEEEERGIFDE